MRRPIALLAALAVLLLPSAANARTGVVARGFESPLFGLSSTFSRHGLLVADAGAGVWRVNGHGKRLLAELPGVTDAEPSRRGIYAVTGAPASALYKLRNGTARPRADLAAFEGRVNPDGREIDSNAFDVEVLSGRHVVVADAAANAVLRVIGRRHIDWIATFPDERVSTRHVKRLSGCPDGPPGICGLPRRMPAQAVPTSVVRGPDGALYVGELKGFPAPRNESRIWRVAPGAHHARCGSSPACRVVGDGFTSIIDLSIGWDGTLYVTELDEAGWLALENGLGVGGTVNACRFGGGHARAGGGHRLHCAKLARHVSMPTAAAATRRGVLATVDSLLSSATVRRIG